MRPLNILMVTAWPPTIDSGGVSTVIRTLDRALTPQQHVAFLVNDWDTKRLRRSRIDRTTCFYLRLRLPYEAVRPVRSVLGWLRDLPMTLFFLRRLLREERIDVVHLHFASAYQYYFRLLRAFGGPPYVVTLHRGDTVNFSTWPKFDQMLTLWMLRGSSRVVAVSRWLARLATEKFPGLGDIGCIHNGLIVSDLEDLAGREGGTLSTIEIPPEFFLMVANVTHYKAPDIAIDAWARVRSRLPDLHLLIVGEARESWDRCAKLIEDLGCGDRVHMIGPLPHDGVLMAMRRATALVFPSRTEGLGMVLLEAGMAGLPAICSDIGPFNEVVKDNETAILVPPDDPGALADAIVRLAGDPQLRQRLARAHGERVRSEFSADSMAARYLALYRAALDDNRQADNRTDSDTVIVP